jgi:hypothetical protein
MVGCKPPAAIEQRIAGSRIGRCDFVVKMKRFLQPLRKP